MPGVHESMSALTQACGVNICLPPEEGGKGREDKHDLRKHMPVKLNMNSYPDSRQRKSKEPHAAWRKVSLALLALR